MEMERPKVEAAHSLSSEVLDEEPKFDLSFMDASSGATVGIESLHFSGLTGRSTPQLRLLLVVGLEMWAAAEQVDVLDRGL